MCRHICPEDEWLKSTNNKIETRSYATHNFYLRKMKDIISSKK